MAPKKKVGRPEFIVDLTKVEALGTIHATDEEIAAIIGCSIRTWYEKKKQDEVIQALERGRATGKMSLRRAQYQAAKKGNPTMLIWLGKQLLGQRDKTYYEVELTDDELNAAIKDQLGKLAEGKAGGASSGAE